MATPYRQQFLDSQKAKVHGITGGDSRYESRYGRAERISGQKHYDVTGDATPTNGGDLQTPGIKHYAPEREEMKG